MDGKELEPICFDWLIESDASPRSFPGVSKIEETLPQVLTSHLLKSFENWQSYEVNFAECSETRPLKDLHPHVSINDLLTGLLGPY